MVKVASESYPSSAQAYEPAADAGWSVSVPDTFTMLCHDWSTVHLRVPCVRPCGQASADSATKVCDAAASAVAVEGRASTPVSSPAPRARHPRVSDVVRSIWHPFGMGGGGTGGDGAGARARHGGGDE